MENQSNSNPTTTFSMLPLEIKVKIFGMLSVGSRYNASFVWEEMEDETWRSISTEREFTRKFEDTGSFSFKMGESTGTSWSISNLEDLETVGVLATEENLDPVDRLELYSVDVSNVPSNILCSLAKIVGKELYLNNVRGFCISMLKIVKDLRHFSVKNMSVKALKQDICVDGDVSLSNICGDVCGLLDSIKCDKLEISYLKLNTNETKSLTKMLTKRVRSLECWGVTLDLSLLANYDGKGECERIWFKSEYLGYAMDIWANSVGWTVVSGLLTNDDQDILITRSAAPSHEFTIIVNGVPEKFTLCKQPRTFMDVKIGTCIV